MYPTGKSSQGGDPMSSRIGSLALVTTTVVCLFTGTVARAQSVTATLVGTVLDSSNAAVPNA